MRLQQITTGLLVLSVGFLFVVLMPIDKANSVLNWWGEFLLVTIPLILSYFASVFLLRINWQLALAKTTMIYGVCGFGFIGVMLPLMLVVMNGLNAALMTFVYYGVAFLALTTLSYFGYIAAAKNLTSQGSIRKDGDAA
jgi:phosphoglycerol transferase MdoB-like AlkP superfamily enzyme